MFNCCDTCDTEIAVDSTLWSASKAISCMSHLWGQETVTSTRGKPKYNWRYFYVLNSVSESSCHVKAEWSSAFRATCTLKIQHTFKITVLTNCGSLIVWFGGFFGFVFFSSKTFLLPVQNFNGFLRAPSLGPLCLVPLVWEHMISARK